MHLSRNNITRGTLLLACLSFFQLFAQDVDRKKVDINYIGLPMYRLPANVETYHVNIKPKNTPWGNTLGNVYQAEGISFNGYYPLPAAGDADLLVEGEVVNELVFEKVNEVTSELTYKKDKNSPEIKYTAYFYQVIYYTPQFRYALKTKEGKAVTNGTIGGELKRFEYGSSSYSNHFSNSYSLAASWSNSKINLLASQEKDAYKNELNSLRNICQAYCLQPAQVEFAVRYVDEKKGRTQYSDLLEARDYYVEAVSTISNDKIDKINKLVQPDYDTRKETMKKAIDLWEKALAEADYDNKKARIDSRVARHLYYNLALAYLWIDDFAKAKEYAQGRKKDVGGWDKNFLAGIQSLSTVIDNRALQAEANKWRQVMLVDSSVYVYKDPATRKKEKEEEAKALLAKINEQRADSIAQLKKSKGNVAKGKGGKTKAKPGVKRRAPPAQKRIPR